MHSLEDCNIVSDIGAGHYSETAHQSCAEIGDNVSVKVLQQQDVELIWINHKLHTGIIDYEIVCFYIVIIGGDLPETTEKQAV